ncbi:hypothetical protein LTR05_008259 [Lithohypha guttulata]|uniref:Uncharacterized protein n=1 Tax=Lithohypha guttulata TaxID=1690604 RepID=A0AAN7STC0_9EURO|nr:hypothetical protein LTR05_008259 [Lithohypha guttulata]
MHRAIALSALTLAANTALVTGLTVNGFNFPGDSHAQSVCLSQPAGSVKCLMNGQLTDVSYVICTNGNEKEQFVAAGTRCEQNGPADVGKLVAGAPTLTHTFAHSTSAAVSAASSAVNSVVTPSASASASASSSVSPTATATASSVSSVALNQTSQVFSIADAIASQVNSVLKTISGLSFTPPASASASVPPASSATPMNSVIVTSPSIATALATASAGGKKRDLASEEGPFPSA